jgi:quercetin 2,3-dioxygenase
MTPHRTIVRTITTAPPARGFIGDGHTAVLVVDPADFAAHDPFILLADDRIDLSPGRTAGEAHPHAGFETVTFVLEGRLHDADEGVLEPGDVQWMTAGRGVIHNEHVVPDGRTRILQLWLTLPEAQRWAAPRFETVRRATAPLREEPGVAIRVYSGRSGTLEAATHNYVPVTLLDARLDPGASVDQVLPASYNGFVYVLDGAVQVGDASLRSAQVGWLDRPSVAGDTVLRLTAGSDGAHVVLYAGEPQHAPIVQHGPFVGGTRADLMRISRDYVDGRFERMSDLVRAAGVPEESGRT